MLHIQNKLQDGREERIGNYKGEDCDNDYEEQEPDSDPTTASDVYVIALEEEDKEEEAEEEEEETSDEADYENVSPAYNKQIACTYEEQEDVYQNL